jgi:hypothetical protein
MTDKVERVAKAIAEIAWSRGAGGVPMPDDHWREWRHEARAAIVEMEVEQQLLQRQLDAVDKVLCWEGNGLGRVGTIQPMGSEIERLREALEMVASEGDAGRHDGLPEPCPLLGNFEMWMIARSALKVDA